MRVDEPQNKHSEADAASRWERLENQQLEHAQPEDAVSSVQPRGDPAAHGCDDERPDISGAPSPETAAAPGDESRSGEDEVASAVEAAHRQQDAGQSWQQYAATGLDGALPPAVEQTGKQADEAESEASDNQQPESLSVRELQNDLAIQQRMLRG